MERSGGRDTPGRMKPDINIPRRHRADSDVCRDEVALFPCAAFLIYLCVPTRFLPKQSYLKKTRRLWYAKWTGWYEGYEEAKSKS